jgi:phosphatidate cytidylyltransferase
MKHSNLFKRILSALVLAPIAIFAVLWSVESFALLLAVVGVVAVYEWMEVTTAEHSNKYFISGLLIAFGIFALVYGDAVNVSENIANGIISVGFAGVVLITWRYSSSLVGQETRDGGIKISICWVMFGLLYMIYAFVCMSAIRAIPGGGEAIMLMLAMVWASDIGAYAFGKIIGGPKLAPTISPGKTWAGFFGAFVFCIAVQQCAVRFMNVEYLTISGAIILCLVAQAGDMLESYAKRVHKVKDSGSLIPGHGGILDRIDSVIAVAIVYGLIIKVAN